MFTHAKHRHSEHHKDRMRRNNRNRGGQNDDDPSQSAVPSSSNGFAIRPSGKVNKIPEKKLSEVNGDACSTLRDLVDQLERQTDVQLQVDLIDRGLRLLTGGMTSKVDIGAWLLAAVKDSDAGAELLEGWEEATTILRERSICVWADAGLLARPDRERTEAVAKEMHERLAVVESALQATRSKYG